MKTCVVALALTVASAQTPVERTSQTSFGFCSPNISNVGAGNVTVQFSGTACQGIDQAAVKQLNDFLATYPQQQRRLLELLDQKDVDIAKKVQQVADLTAKYQDAVRQYEEAHGKLETLSRPENLARLQMNAVAGKDLQAMDQTIQVLQAAADKSGFELDPQILVRIGLYFAARTKFDNAIPYFLAAAKQNPSLASAYSGLASVYQLEGNQYLRIQEPEKAKEALDKAEEYAKLALQNDQTDTTSLDQLGYARKDLADYYSTNDSQDKAAEARNSAGKLFRMALSVNPKDPSAHNGLGNVYYLEGDLDNSIREYQTATELFPAYTFAWYDLAISLYQKYRNGGLSQEDNAKTLLALLSALQKISELSQDSAAQLLPDSAAKTVVDLAKWAIAETKKYKQDN